MAERILLFDLGNTRLKYCWAIDGALDTDLSGTLDHAHLSELADAAGSYPDRIVLASVARDEVTDMLVEISGRLFGPEVERLHTGTAAAGITNGYPEPERLGVDRWLAMVGGAARHGLPLVVMDIGSATTLDAVDGDGRHLGGWILPGPLTMHRALVSGTGLAAEVPADLPSGPAADTAAAIAAGIGGAHRGALAGFLDGLPATMDGATVVLAGGGAEPVAEALAQAGSPLTVTVDPWLVFAGMLQVATDDTTQGR